MSQRVEKELQGIFDGEKVGHSRMDKQLWIWGRGSPLGPGKAS